MFVSLCVCSTCSFAVTALKVLTSILDLYKETIVRHRALSVSGGVDVSKEDRVQRCCAASDMILGCFPAVKKLAARTGLVAVYATQMVAKLQHFAGNPA